MRLSTFELLALWQAADGLNVPRPVLRRLKAAGLVANDTNGYSLTPQGMQHIMLSAPRCEWKPPVSQALTASAAVILATALAIPSRRRLR